MLAACAVGVDGAKAAIEDLVDRDARGRRPDRISAEGVAGVGMYAVNNPASRTSFFSASACSPSTSPAAQLSSAAVRFR